MAFDMGAETENRLEFLEGELERLIEFAVGEVAAEKIILFGSMAGDSSKVGEWSDLDLAAAETALPFHRRSGEILRGARPEAGADILVYTPSEWELMKAGNPFIKEEVLEKGRVVYERDG